MEHGWPACSKLGGWSGQEVPGQMVPVHLYLLLDEDVHLFSLPLQNPPDWQEILTYFHGSELQNYFTCILEDNLKFAVLITILILLEAGLVGVLVFDKNWEEDLPSDSTGELKRLCAFIEENMDICKWVALTVMVIQALSLLLAVILRAMVFARRVDYDSDEDFIVARRPLLNPQGGPTYPPASGDSKGFHSDFWSSQLRQKYGLNQSKFSYNGIDPKDVGVGKLQQ